MSTGIASRIRGTAQSIESKTPESRDRLLDGLRALAILGVVVGHWLVSSFVIGTEGPDAVLHAASPLDAMGWLAPATWAFQMLALFFLVGGRTAIMSYTRALERGSSYWAWLSGRLIRLLKPAILAIVLWLVAGSVLFALGMPLATLIAAVKVMIAPLWFLAVFTVLTALTPLAIWLDRRFGWWAPIGMAACVAAVDALRYGPLADSMPSWLALVNLLPGWMFAYQIGVRWFRGTPSRRVAAAWCMGGATMFATLVLAFGYPASMVGGVATERTNAHPPSLLVLALGAVQIGLVFLFEDRIRAVLTRPMVWMGAVVVNLAAVTILCWHQLAAIVPAMVVVSVGGSSSALAGLTSLPDDGWWVLARIAWIPVFAAVFVGLWFVARGLERGPRKGNDRRESKRSDAGAISASRGDLVSSAAREVSP